LNRGNAAGVATGHGKEPRPTGAGRPKRSHRRPARFLDSVAASLMPIGRNVAWYRIVSHVGCQLVLARMHSEPFEMKCTCSDISVAVNNVSMLRKRNSMSDHSDVEPSSSEGEQTDSERGERPAQELDGLETAAKRMAESPAWPATTEVRFDVNGGAYLRRRAPSGRAVSPPSRRDLSGAEGRAACHGKTKRSSVTSSAGSVTMSMCLRHAVASTPTRYSNMVSTIHSIRMSSYVYQSVI